MSKVYEALLHARAENFQTKIPEPQTTPLPPSFIATNEPLTIDSSPLEREMLILNQSIADLTRNTKGTVIQFLGLQGGEGTSTIVREFAKIGVGKNNNSALIVDAYRTQPQLNHFKINPLPSLEQSVQNDWDLNEAMHPIGTTQLFLSSLYPPMSSGTDVSSLATQEHVFEQLRSRFDTVLLDTPPINTSVDGLSLCKQMDGVVLVVEAERTKSVIIQQAKDRIIQGGGRLIGIVFNKQQHYIPNWVYRWL